MNRAWKVSIIIALLVAGFLGGYGLFYASNNLRAAAIEENTTGDLDAPEATETGDINGDPASGSGEKHLGGQATAKPSEQKGKSPSRQKPVLQGDIQYIAASDLDNILILANKSWNLPQDYIPVDLVDVEAPFVSYALPERRKMRAEAAAAMAELVEGAKVDGLEILCVSGYRSYGTQKVIFENKVKAVGTENALKYVAFPGQSEHQTGLSMDVTSQDLISGALTTVFGNTEEAKWLVDNSHRFGFIIRYQAGKESITGYNYEPWHIRYVGKADAQYMYEQGLTLEEYLEPVQNSAVDEEELQTVLN